MLDENHEHAHRHRTGEGGIVKLSRRWHMPNHSTFKIKPIAALLETYNVGHNWADPFCGESTLCEYRNDYKLSGIDSFEWMKTLPGNLSGAVIDPPYSPRQIKEHYRSVRNSNVTFKDYQDYYSRAYKMIAPKLTTGGLLITCGWHSNGHGKRNGFEKLEVLLVAHGGAHNDTIVTVEVKLQSATDPAKGEG